MDYVGPQVGKQLRNRGVMALLYAMMAILIYVAFRFDFKFGPGALLAMLHDVVMVAGYYLVSRARVQPHRPSPRCSPSSATRSTTPSSSTTASARRWPGSRASRCRRSSTSPSTRPWRRTILTSGVTALSLVGLLIFGVGEICDFAVAMLVGIVVGTYSSVYIASPLTIWLDERAAARQARQKGSMNQPKTA